MTTLLFALGVLVFAVGVALSIALHEVGHLLPGKLFGVKVTQYFIGFGPTVWSTRRGETEYGIKAIPFGGFVKLVGMLPPAKDGRAATESEKDKDGFFSQMVDDARAAEAELVGDGDEHRQFYRLPVWKKLVVMGSGVATNLVLSFILFGVVFMGYGVPTATTTVESVSECVIAVTEENASTPPRDCRDGDPQAPAAEAGFEAGDRIVSFNGEPIGDWDEMQRAIRGNGEGVAEVVVERDGREVTLTTNTTVTPRDVAEEGTRIEEVGFLGVSPTSEIRRQGAGYVVSFMGESTWKVLKGIATLPPKVYHVGLAALGLEERDPEGPMSIVGGGRVSGEIASQQEVPLSGRIIGLVFLLAGLNLFLGMFNLVPLMPLDGGQIAPALYEGARRMVARLRRRPDPGYVDVARLLPVGYVMAGVILVASLVLVWGDIVAPIPRT